MHADAFVGLSIQIVTLLSDTTTFIQIQLHVSFTYDHHWDHQ